MTKRVIEREQSIMGRIFFIFKVNTVEKVLRERGDFHKVTTQVPFRSSVLLALY